MRKETHDMLMTVEIEYGEADKIESATATLGIDKPVPFAVMMVAAEQLMTFVALESGAGFEAALESLCKGARTNKIELFRGNKVV